MMDLFDRPVVPGLSLFPDLVGTDEEARLIARLDAVDLSPFRFQQWTGKRLTRSFGWTYDFVSGGLARAEPIPSWLLPLKARAADLAGLPDEALVQVLLIRYDPGAGIGWHKDRPAFGHVLGISLGNPATLRLRRRAEQGFRRAKVELPPGSLYRLSDEVRHHWEHSIAPMDLPRWSITFRTLASTDH